jgi:hypothetical protein
MYDPRTSLPKPSRFAAARRLPKIDDVVVYAGQGYRVASILDMSQPLHPDGPTGLFYVLRRTNWERNRFLIIPAVELDQPAELAA